MSLRKWAGYGVCLILLLPLANSWIQAQAPQLNTGAPTRLSDRTLLYVGIPTKRGNSDGRSVIGIHVFDVYDKFSFVKRIPTFDYPAWEDPMVTDQVTGIGASPATGKLLMSTFKGLHAFDLFTEKKVWTKLYEGRTVDRFALSPDGKIMYAPDGFATGSRWHVIDVDTGNLITTVPTPKTTGNHNTVWAPDGSKVFMAGVNSPYISVADPKTHKVIKVIGPFGGEDYPVTGLKGQRWGGVRPYTTNGRGTLLFVNINGLWGFEVADVETGKIIHRVEVGYYQDPADSKKGVRPTMPNCEGVPNHGIAMTPDEKEIWLTDDITGALRVFDATVMPPRPKAIVMMPRHANSNFPWPCWVTIGLDGKFVYSSTGDVVDAGTKQVVASLKDDAGQWVRSEKMIEVQWSQGKPVRASNQFGRGMVGAVATDNN